MWERWDSLLPDGSINPGEMTSFNHYALGSVGHWIHSTLGGISPLSPGWKTILFAPVPGGTITSARTTYLSPYGQLGCAWETSVLKGEGEEGKQRKRIMVEIQVPPNSNGVVVLPGIEERKMVGSGDYVFESEFVDDEDWPPKATYSPFAQYMDRDD